MTERFICPFSTRVGDKGQRYEVWCFDGEGGLMQVGYSEEPDGGSLTQMVHEHPMWHSPWIVDRETPGEWTTSSYFPEQVRTGKLLRAANPSPDLAEGEDHGDVSTHILKHIGVRPVSL